MCSEWGPNIGLIFTLVPSHISAPLPYVPWQISGFFTWTLRPSYWDPLPDTLGLGRLVLAFNSTRNGETGSLSIWNVTSPFRLVFIVLGAFRGDLAHHSYVVVIPIQYRNWAVQLCPRFFRLNKTPLRYCVLYSYKLAIYIINTFLSDDFFYLKKPIY